METSSTADSWVQRSLTIRATPEQLLERWSDPEVQRAVLHDRATLVSGDRQQMVWSVRTHGDRHVDVRSRQVEWNEGRSVRYLSEGDRDLRVESELTVTPGPTDWGTQASLRVGYSLPGGVVAETLAKWLGSAPELLVSTVLHRFKALLETGEFPTLERNPSARDNDDNP
ncbi:putative membrane protein [Lysobacter sp. OAE881]|uniref:SRPBCC family protein n=1 Tax=Lysobacter sp. OAE881 TaxID=2663813 RepID=UPI001789A993